ncbi:MAG: hypothetical protein RMM51_01455 [Verrucomicrobiae bacterium]|nr:hypothetical protein [Verrucomicrobiae bacterium]
MRSVVLEELARYFERQYGVRAERDRVFLWPEGTVRADLYLPPPLHCLVQFDDEEHCTRQRAETIAQYPPDLPVNFDVRRYLNDTRDGDAAVARTDSLADRLPVAHGLNPTVRIRYDELTEPLRECLEKLLARRLAYHAGTTFQQMLVTAGGKPHRPVMEQGT